MMLQHHLYLEQEGGKRRRYVGNQKKKRGGGCGCAFPMTGGKRKRRRRRTHKKNVNADAVKFIFFSALFYYKKYNKKLPNGPLAHRAPINAPIEPKTPNLSNQTAIIIIYI